MAITKVGLAGLGYIGRKHLVQLRSLGLSVVTADPKLESADAEALGSTRHYADFQQLLVAEQPEAVVICLPTFMHRDSVIMALEHGSHVLVEKPFALCLPDIDDMMATAKKQGRRIMVAHVCRFMGQNIKAHELIDNGSLGCPVHFSAWRMSPTPMWSDKNWLGNASASGGTVMDFQIHDIDLACWLLGEPIEMALIKRQDSSRSGSGFFHAIGCLGFRSGVSASLDTGHLMPAGYPFTSGFRLVFDRGVLQCDMVGFNLTLKQYEDGVMTDLTGWYGDHYAERNPYRDESEHFLKCLESGTDFVVTTLEARQAVEVVLKLREHEILATRPPSDANPCHLLQPGTGS